MLDFKDWKKTKEDGKSVTMKHPKGHEMIILLKGVPGIQKEALKRLPLSDGGEIGVNKSSMEVERPENKKEKKMAGESKAGEMLRSSDIKDTNQKAKDEHNKVLGEMKSMPQPKLKSLTKGGDPIQGEDVPVSASKLESQYGPEDEAAQSKSDEGSSPKSLAYTPAAPQSPPVVVNVGQPSPAAGQAGTPIEVQQPNVPSNNPNVLLPNGSMNAPAAAQTGQQAIQGQQQIDTARAQAMVPVEQARLKALQLNAQQDQDNINSLKTHAQNLADNIKNIDPDAYRKNMSAPGKVATGIGLFLGGFSVPFGGQNFAQEFLNKQIDRDIDAQKANNEKQKTIWGAYNQLYGDQNISSNMTKASMAQAYADQIDQIAAKLGTPQALVNAQKLKAGLSVTANKAILDSAGNLRSLPNNPGAPQKVPQNGQEPQQPSEPQAGNPPPLIGQATANASIQPQLIKPDSYADSPVLKSNSQELFDDLRYTPKAKEEFPKIEQQWNSALKADQALGQLHSVHQQLYSDAKEGMAGNFRRGNAAEHIPFVGGLINQGIVQPITANEPNKRYDAYRTRVVGDIASALKGSNIGVEEVQRVVNDNLPQPHDSPALVAQKERNIRLFIKNNLDTSLLKDWHLQSGF